MPYNISQKLETFRTEGVHSQFYFNKYKHLLLTSTEYVKCRFYNFHSRSEYSAITKQFVIVQRKKYKFNILYTSKKEYKY